MEKKRDDAQNTDHKKNPVHEKSDDPSYVTKPEDAVTDVDLANEKTIETQPGDAGAGGPADPASPKRPGDGEDHKGSKGRVVAAVVVVAAIAAGGYYYAQNNTLSNPSQTAAQSDSAGASNTANTPADGAAAPAASGGNAAPTTEGNAEPGDAKPGVAAPAGTDQTAATSPETPDAAEKTSPSSSPDTASSAAAPGATDTPTSEPAASATSADSTVNGQDEAAQEKSAEDTAEGVIQKPENTNQSEPAVATGGQTASETTAAGQAPGGPQDQPASAAVADSQVDAQGAGEASMSALPSDIRDQLQRQSSQIIALRDQLEASERRLQQLQTDRLQMSRNQTSLFVLNDVSRLVSMAQNELAIAGNLQNAVRSLETARDAITRANAPVLSGLQAAIASDIVTLKSSPVASVDTLFGQVSALSQKLDTLPMIAPDQVGARPMATSAQDKAAADAMTNPDAALPADAAWYDRAWNEVKQWPSAAWSGLRSDLGGIVRVEKLSDPNQVLLTVDQAMQLRNNLKQNLHFAQQALLNGQQGIWTASLETVVKGLKSSFNQDSSETQQALAQAQDLLKQTVRPAMPELEQSARAVQETRKQLESLNPAQE